MSKVAHVGYFQRVRDRYGLAISQTFNCVLVAGFVGICAGMLGGLHLRVLVALASVPCVASLILMALLLLAPDIFGEGKLRMPLPFTIPTIFVFLLLAWNMSFIQRAFGYFHVEIVDRLRIWQSPIVLVIIWVALVVMSFVQYNNASEGDTNSSSSY